MGSLCSKSSYYEGGHTVLGPPPATSTSHTVLGSAAANGNTIGSNPVGSRRAAPAPSDPRAAAAEAAERRLQAAQRRGTNEANPKQGKLAGQLAKQTSSRPNPQSREEERLVWD